MVLTFNLGKQKLNVWTKLQKKYHLHKTTSIRKSTTRTKYTWMSYSKAENHQKLPWRQLKFKKADKSVNREIEMAEVHGI